MKKYLMVIGIPALLLLAACTEAEKAPATQSQSVTAPVSSAQSAPADVHDDHTDHAGHADESAPATGAAPVTLASGEEIEVISVGYFDENLKSLDGLVAIEGRVKESYADRGALILVDCTNMEGCTDGCCPQVEVPVRLDMANYTGELPAADQEVVIVGDLTVQELGYELAVREIRHGADTLVALKS